MKKVKFLVTVISGSIALMISGCEENAFTMEAPVAGARISGKTIEKGNDDGPPRRGDYPEITFEVFSPEDLYNMRSLVWRITWPEYAENYDVKKIPTVFNPDGSLRSINFLNTTSHLNSLKSVFSLFHENKIKKAGNMGNVLNHVENPPPGSMESVVLKYDFDHETDIEEVKFSVENSPGYMPHRYLDVHHEVEEFAYSEGDVIFFKLSGPHYTRYGAIWIASMSPRIIEVYMTASNDISPDDLVFE